MNFDSNQRRTYLGARTWLRGAQERSIAYCLAQTWERYGFPGSDGPPVFVGAPVSRTAVKSGGVFIVGAKGSGKTTFIHAMLASILPTMRPRTQYDFRVYPPRSLGKTRVANFDFKREGWEKLLPMIPSNIRARLFSFDDERGERYEVHHDVHSPMQALELACALVPDHQNEVQKFFTLSARLILSAIIEVFAIARSAFTLHDAINVALDEARLRALLQLTPSGRQALGAMAESQTDTWKSIKATLAAVLSRFRVAAQIWQKSQQSGFSVHRFLDRSEFVNFHWNEELAEALRPTISHLIASIHKRCLALQREEDLTVVVMDECKFLDMRALRIDAVAAAGRTAGLLDIGAVQGAGAFRAGCGYNHDLAREIMAGFGTIVLMRMAPEDAQFFSQFIGQCEIIETTYNGGSSTTWSSTSGGGGSSTTTGGGTNFGWSQSMQTRPLLTAGDLESLPPGDWKNDRFYAWIRWPGTSGWCRVCMPLRSLLAKWQRSPAPPNLVPRDPRDGFDLEGVDTNALEVQLRALGLFKEVTDES